MRCFLSFSVSLSALILLPHSCFATDRGASLEKGSVGLNRKSPSVPFSIGDSPGGVSFWSDYRGPQYEGYASIGCERSRAFWEEKSSKRINIPIDTNSVLELKQLWKKFFNMRPDLKYDFSIFDTKNLKDWPDIDVVVAEIRRTELLSDRQKDKLHEKVLFEAGKLSNTYLHFKALFKMPIEKRTTESFDESRKTLAEMIGEDAVQQLEQSWIANTKVSH
jgi:hypothetical protein